VALRAVVFDFDGLVVDTETPILRGWEAEFARHGVEFPADLVVAANTGTVRGQAGYIDEYDLLEELVGGPVDRDAIQARRVAMHAEWLERAVPNPGVLDWIDAVREAGMGIAIASSSSRQWVEDNLARLGLSGRFDAVLTRTDVEERAKPDPAVYRAAVDALAVDASQAAALEDSPHGVRAAKAAGLTCVAVPSGITVGLDFGHADLVVDSLLDFTLADLIARLDGDRRA